MTQPALISASGRRMPAPERFKTEYGKWIDYDWERGAWTPVHEYVCFNTSQTMLARRRHWREFPRQKGNGSISLPLLYCLCQRQISHRTDFQERPNIAARIKKSKGVIPRGPAYRKLIRQMKGV